MLTSKEVESPGMFRPERSSEAETVDILRQAAMAIIEDYPPPDPAEVAAATAQLEEAMETETSSEGTTGGSADL